MKTQKPRLVFIGDECFNRKMNTRERLNQYLKERNPPSEEADLVEAIRFLCSELDQLRAPVRVQYRLCAADAKVPAYQTDGASGLDLHANRLVIEQFGEVGFPYTLQPDCSVMIWSGVAFSIPKGWEIQVRPRSSMSKQLIHACLGTIDSDYRGEIGVRLQNLGGSSLVINKHDRVAQAVFAPVGRFELERVETLDATKRGDSGFGSTGR